MVSRMPPTGIPHDRRDLFVYGTLRFPEVLRALLGRVPGHRPAAANGWRVAGLPGRVYPGLVPGDGMAHGHLITGLTPNEWRTLDAFEGPQYELKRLALTQGGHAWAYVWTPVTEVEPDDWSPEDFGKRHLPAYVERCAAWRRIADGMTG